MFAAGPSNYGTVLTGVELKITGGIPELLDAVLPHRVREDGVKVYAVEHMGEMGAIEAIPLVNAQGLGQFTDSFIFHARGTSRLTGGDSQAIINFQAERPGHPVHRAYRDPGLEHELNDQSLAAFGLGITVDRVTGSVISLRVGDRPRAEYNEGVPTQEYIDAVWALPRLEEQGDGVRSYLGLLLHMLAGSHQMVLVDEPEAFLHPPQARRLGGILARKAAGSQAFVATHSSDIVQGALDADSTTTIIRVTREGRVNHAAVLAADAVNDLWSDPLLRYSKLLDGLFHDVVVICEGDADCRYYAALFDELESAQAAQSPRAREPQVLFTHCGGKARIASVARSLRAASVPVVVVADFDILRNRKDVANIVEALGGDSTIHDADIALVNAALTNSTKPLRRVTLRDAINSAIDGLENDILDQKDADKLRALLKPENGWDRAKAAGKGSVPQGDASDACTRAIAGLEEVGLLVVPVGELERFAPEVSGHGPAWVNEVMERGLHKRPGRDAADFVATLRMATRSAAGLASAPPRAEYAPPV